MPGLAPGPRISGAAIRRLLEEEQYQADTRKHIEDTGGGDVLHRCRQLNAFLRKVSSE